MSAKLAALAIRLRAALAHPRVIVRVTALTAVLSIPALFHGLLGDDHTLRGFLLGVPPWAEWAKSPLELFSFYDGDPARTGSLVHHGFSQWWTDGGLRIMFFRPLSALGHWIDFRLWPGSPALMHLHTVAFYLGLVAAAGALYRRVLGPGWAPGFAVAVYAFDHTHGVLVEWISNRNALVAATFAVLSLVLQDRARREGRALLALGSALCLALGLLGGEVALGAAGYLAAYALFLDDRPARARLAGALPHLAVLIAWAVAYRAGGFGASGSGMYVDAGRLPLAFARLAIDHLPLLLQSELGGPAPDILFFVPHPSPLIDVGAAIIVGVALLAMAPLRADRRARYLLAGALLATVPVCSTAPAGRLMLMPGLGLLGLVALVVEGVVDRTLTWRPGPSRWAALYVAAWAGGGHLCVSPLLMEASMTQMLVVERIISRYGDALGDDPALGGQRVVVVNAVDAFFTYYIVGQRITAGRVAPGRMLVLASGTRRVELERRSADALLVRSDEGFYRTGTELLTRAADAPMPVGTRVDLADVSVEVTRANAAGLPTEALFRFDRPLEDATLRWVEWRGPTFVPFRLPAIGETRRIEAQVPPLW